jgi:hypothetical protein
MGQERQMRQFLNQLDQQLTALDAVDRSRIIQQMQEQLEENLKQNPSTSLQKVLDDLGPVDKIANRYLVEHGKPTVKLKRFGFWQLILYGWLGSVAIVLVWLTVMVLKFSPVFKVDEAKNQIIILGGLIEIDGEAGKVKAIDNYHFGKSQYPNHFDGNLNADGRDLLNINFSNGRHYLKSGTNDDVIWTCRLSELPSQAPVTETDNNIVMDFSPFEGSDCEIVVPADFSVIVKGVNGTIYLEHPIFDSTIEMSNGEVLVRKAPDEFYEVDVKLQNGVNSLIDDGKGYKLQIQLDNGSISRF